MHHDWHLQHNEDEHSTILYWRIERGADFFQACDSEFPQWRLFTSCYYLWEGDGMYLAQSIEWTDS